MKRSRTSDPPPDLTAAERSALFEDLNYLNLGELRRLCRRYGIPYRVRVEERDGSTRATSTDDRKGIVLARLRHYLESGERLPATVLSATVAGPTEPPGRLTPRDRLHFNWYKRTNAPVFDLLRKLTGGRYRDGARARMMLMERWGAGRAPTFSEFAEEWLEAESAGESIVAAEYAYLTDLRAGRADADWKALRRERARRALTRLGEEP